jgi:ribonuclease J
MVPYTPTATKRPFSGHAPREDLLEVVRRLRPRHLLPVHTERPHLWKHRLQGEGVKVLL